jgi:hypothetical protein
MHVKGEECVQGFDGKARRKEIVFNWLRIGTSGGLL